MASAYKNPGPYEQASQDAKRLVMLDCHDGFRCDINKQLSPYMAVVHSFWLGTSMLQDRNKTYTWLTQVADESSLYMARVDPERQSVDGRIHKTLLGGLALIKLQVGLSPEGQNDQCMAEVDLSGITWTANLKYGSAIGGLLYGCNFYQAITPNLSMGGEGMYVAANQNLASNYVLKYSMPAPAGDDEEEAFSTSKTQNGGEQPSSTIIASFNTTGALTLNYKRVITPYRVTLGAELTCNPMTAESAVILGAEFKWTRSKLAVTLDGNAKMQSLLETKLGKEPGQPSLHFSADLDHLKDEMRFGYGLSIDG
jgi:mitochondrial import receptor subunit TOM40